MSDSFDTETWLPDLVERCQDGLRYSWYADGRGACWYLSRSALERLLQEDDAGNDLPLAWRKLLVVANLPAEFVDLPEPQRFIADDFEELERWSRRLGGKLDLTPEPVLEPAVPGRRPMSPLVAYAFAASVVLVCLGVSAYWSTRLSRAAQASRDLGRRLDVVQSNARSAQVLTEQARRDQLVALGKIDVLENENRRLKSQAKPTPTVTPAIDLRSLLLPRSAGPSSGWDVRTPAFTAVRRSPSVFTWPPGKSSPAKILVFEERTHKRVWSHPTNLATGTIRGLPKLEAGRTYLWSIVTDSEDEGYSAVPFYILSLAQLAQLDRSFRSAKSDGDRAAVTAQFGLFDELGSFGIEAKRRFALQTAP